MFILDSVKITGEDKEKEDFVVQIRKDKKLIKAFFFNMSVANTITSRLNHLVVVCAQIFSL